jgi:hypothetical protein
MIKDGTIHQSTATPSPATGVTGVGKDLDQQVIEFSRTLENVFTANIDSKIPVKSLTILKRIEKNTRQLLGLKSKAPTQFKTPTRATDRGKVAAMGGAKVRSKPPARIIRDTAPVASRASTPGVAATGPTPMTSPAPEIDGSKAPVISRAAQKRPTAPTPTRESKPKAERERLHAADPARENKSKAAQVKRQQVKMADKQAKVISGSVAKGMGAWGLVKGAMGMAVDVAKKEDTVDVVGTAIGGPVWEAVKEVKEATAGIRSEIADEETMLGKLVGKVTAGIKGRDKNVPSNWKKDKRDRWHDEKGRVVSKADLKKRGIGQDGKTEKIKPVLEKQADILNANVDASKDIVDALKQKTAVKSAKKANAAATAKAAKSSDRADQQVEISQEELDTSNLLADILTDSERDEEKRHKDLIRAVVSSGGGQGGRSRRKSDRGPRRVSKIGKLGGGLKALAGLGMGGGMLGGLMGGGGAIADMVMDVLDSQKQNSEAITKSTTGAIKKGASPNADAATKKKATKEAGKKVAKKTIAKGALKGVAKFARVLGPAAAIGMTAFDAVSGWKDATMQMEAFNLEAGEAATTGQKAASAVANAIDLGGMGTAVARMFGADVNTADIAKKTHDMGSKIGKMFGFGKDKASQSSDAVDYLSMSAPTGTKTGNIAPVKSKAPSEITGPDHSKLNAGSSGSGPATTKEPTGFRRLTMAIERLVSAKERKSQPQQIGEHNISMDFDDATLMLVAMDRM